LQQIAKGQALSLEAWNLAGRRCLYFGQFAGRVTLALWLTTSLVFPLWIKMANPNISVEWRDYLHFVFSQAFCGLISAALTYFFITLICVRALYPRLIPPNLDDAEAAEELMHARRPVIWYFRVLGVVPLASLSIAFLLLAYGMFEAIAADRAVPISFAMLGGIGMLGFVVCWKVGQVIQDDLAALYPAVCQSRHAAARDGDSALLGSTRHGGLSESSRSRR
jgi:hypothetical protein